MFTATFKLAFIWTTLCIQLVFSQSRHNQYASILQDTRNEPTPDGHFGYLYKTEDGITSSASGDPSGVIHGTFSYTDPTGLRVNYNYNAGSRFTPGYNYNKDRSPAAAPAPVPAPSPVSARLPAPAVASKYYKNPAPASSRYREPIQEYQQEPEYYREAPQEQYVEPSPRYRSRGRPAFRDSADVYQERRYRPSPRGGNDLFDDVNYRG